MARHHRSDAGRFCGGSAAKAIFCGAAWRGEERCQWSTDPQQMSEAFAKASRHIEAEERAVGSWIWRAKTGRTSSLAPCGQKAPVAWLTVRPLLLTSVAVGRVLCRAAAQNEQGEAEEKVEDWQLEAPPIWRRWKEAADAVRGGHV